jgi:hypothetical protein
MQERQIRSNTRKRADRQSKTAPAENFRDGRQPSLYSLRSTNPQHQQDLSFVLPTLVTPNSHHSEHYIFTIIIIRFFVVQFQSLEGQRSCIPLIPLAESWQIRVACTTSTQHKRIRTTRHHQTRSIASYCSGRLYIFPSLALSLRLFVGDCKQQISKYSPSPHCTTTPSRNRLRTHRSLCTAIV